MQIHTFKTRENYKNGKINQPRNGSDFQTNAITNFASRDPSRKYLVPAKYAATIATIEYK